MPVTLSPRARGWDLFEQKGIGCRPVVQVASGSRRQRDDLRVPAALRQTNLVETLASLLRLLAELEPLAVEAQIERLGDWLAGKAAFQELDGGLTRSFATARRDRRRWPELLCQAEIFRPVPLAGLIEEVTAP